MLSIQGCSSGPKKIHFLMFSCKEDIAATSQYIIIITSIYSIISVGFLRINVYPAVYPHLLFILMKF